MSEDDLDLSNLDGFEISSEKIIRLRIVGPNSERDRVDDFVNRIGARIVQSGPYTDSDTWPTVDPERFLYTIEMKVE